MLPHEKRVVRRNPLVEIRDWRFQILGPVIVQNHRTLARNGHRVFCRRRARSRRHGKHGC